MAKVGFSSWVVAENRYAEAINILSGLGVPAIEFSALREEELPSLIADFDTYDLTAFEYVSVHAPSRLTKFSESELAELLLEFVKLKLPVVLHPDVVSNFALWRPFGKYLLIENMDKRKTTGRTCEELLSIFEELPEAGLCFDLAHARQVDPTLREALTISRKLKSRIQEIHVSEVDTKSRHASLSIGAYFAYQRIAPELCDEVPVIIEAPNCSDGHRIETEMRQVKRALSKAA